MKKLNTTDDYFDCILNLTPDKLAFITGERKYTNGHEFCAFLLYHSAVEIHKIDPYSTFGLLRGTQLYYVTNDRAFHSFFISFVIFKPLHFKYSKFLMFRQEVRFVLGIGWLCDGLIILMISQGQPLPVRLLIETTTPTNVFSTE